MPRVIRIGLLTAAMLAGHFGLSDRASAQEACDCASCAAGRGGGGGIGSNLGAGTIPTCRFPDHGHPDLFYDFYVPPNCGGVGAQMYLAPGPIPPHVGHTYYTYQPFMPHELLYKHKRVYHRYYNEGRGLTRTSVRWR